MKPDQPIPQGEHLNKRKVILLGVGLFVVLMVIYSFTTSLFGGEEVQSHKRSYQQGQADFLHKEPDSNTLNATAQNLGGFQEDTSFVPPPPDSVFKEPKKSVSEYVQNEFRDGQQTGPRGRYSGGGSNRRQSPQQSQVDPELQAFREAQQGDGTIYNARRQEQNYNQPQNGYSQSQLKNDQAAGQQTNGQQVAPQQYPSHNPYQQPQPGRGFQNSQHEQISGQMKTPQTPYTLMEGHLIPATLETEIDSDLPGDIRAFVTRDIYDSITMDYLLIPKGTTLIGSYDERVVLNQEKLLMSWERMIFPDGRSIRLPKLNSYDLQGQSGLSGNVDKHFWKIFGQSAFLSLIGAATNASMPQQSGFYQQRDAATMASQQIAQEFNRVSNEVLRRNLNMAPTINIPGATPFYIFLAGDISFQEPYEYSPPEE